MSGRSSTRNATGTRNHMPGPESIAVCIPFYGKEVGMLQAAIDSAASQLPSESEFMLLPDGPEALACVDELRLPSELTVVPSRDRVGLVGNWNRCLTLTSASLIHILHDDDAVAPGFYETVLQLAREHPGAALYATAARLLSRAGSADAGVSARRWLNGDGAARFLLADSEYACGSVVLSRRAVEQAGLFREEFHYCPDEEAYLRYAAAGGLAVSPAPLYLMRTHPGQTRRSTWRCDDFVRVYFASRRTGAELYGAETVQFAEWSSARRVISLALTLAFADETRVAAKRLNDLVDVYPAYRRSTRLWLARAVVHFRALRAIAGMRRVVLERRRAR
jgi:hypothetical protein